METSRAFGIDGVSESIVITVGVLALWSWQCFCWLDVGGSGQKTAPPRSGWPDAAPRPVESKIEIANT